MTKSGSYLILVAALVSVLPLQAIDGDAQEVLVPPAENQRLRALERAVEETRRDQLNYKIERDLLKEAYSSNLETVNVVITIILGVSAVFGYLGVRSISGLRDDFRSELESFRKQREELDSKLAQLQSKQIRTDEQLTAVTVSNERQEARLRTLEIQEKAINLITSKNFSRALDYIAIGLDSEPNNIILLTFKQRCYFGLGKLEDAARITELLVECEPDNTDQITNLAELYLLLNRLKAHDTLLSKFPAEVEKMPYLTWHFQATRAYIEGNTAALMKYARELMTLMPSTEKKKYTTWSYNEAKSGLSGKPESSDKRLLFKCYDVLSGEASPDDLRILIEPPNEGIQPSSETRHG